MLNIFYSLSTEVVKSKAPEDITMNYDDESRSTIEAGDKRVRGFGLR